MKTSKIYFIVSAILMIATMTIQPRLVAEESDGTGDRAPEGEVEDAEQLANPEDELHKPANLWPQGSYVIITPGGVQGLHLGPTGLWGVPMGQNIWIKNICSLRNIQVILI